jgi:hypothetical protein
MASVVMAKSGRQEEGELLERLYLSNLEDFRGSHLSNYIVYLFLKDPKYKRLFG